MIERPIIILGAPRSGTTILQRSLSLHPDLWHLPNESHKVLEPALGRARERHDAHRALADDVDDAMVERLRRDFYRHAINLNRQLADPGFLFRGQSLLQRGFNHQAMFGFGLLSQLRKPASIRFLEKTPRNTLRVPLLARLFPDALFISLRRRAPSNIDSLIEGWYAVDKIGPFSRSRFSKRTNRFAAELGLQGYHDEAFKFALVPGWRTLKGRTVADAAALQYYQCNYYTLTDLAAVAPGQALPLKYEDFVQQPVEMVRRIFEWAGLSPSPVAERFAAALPRINDVSRTRRPAGSNLRHPEAVTQAIERLHAIGDLQLKMGYED